MIKIFYRNLKNKTLKELDEFKPGSWILVENPTEEEKGTLIEKYNIDPGLLEDALDKFEVPRIEKDKKTTYVFTRYPIVTNNEITTTPITVIISDTFVLTIENESSELLNPFLNSNVKFSTTQKTKFFFQIFHQINIVYQKSITSINRKVRSLSVNIEKIKNRDIIQFVRFEKALNDFLSALVSTNNALEKVQYGKFLPLYEDDSELAEDLSLNEEQLIEICKSNLKTIVNVRSAYSTILTNNLNRVIKLLTIITIILTVPTMIAGLFGMNVALPVNTESTSVFFGVIILSFVIAVVVLGWVYRK